MFSVAFLTSWHGSNSERISLQISPLYTFICEVFESHSKWSNAERVSVPTTTILPTIVSTYHDLNCCSHVIYTPGISTCENIAFDSLNYIGKCYRYSTRSTVDLLHRDDLGFPEAKTFQASPCFRNAWTFKTHLGVIGVYIASFIISLVFYTLSMTIKIRWLNPQQIDKIPYKKSRSLL